jgi:DNA replication licensing factor MCM5
MCTNCRATRIVSSARAFGTIQLPRTCENASNENNEKPCPMDPFMILADKSSFLDVQKLKLQESPEDIPTGEMPRHIWFYF